jgi:predicted RNA-binding Zn ribbon-like protein
MLFAHDTEISFNATAALVNTARGSVDELPDVAALDAFVELWRWTGSRTHDQAELDAVRNLRPRLAELWDMTQDEAVQLVNTLLRDANALPQLVRHDDWEYHIHATSAEAPLADRMAVDVAMAFADLIRFGELERLRYCAAADCDNVMIDLSKNRSRRFCGLTCANRVNVAAYRSRRNAS